MNQPNTQPTAGYTNPLDIGNLAHPSSELYLGESDKAAIESVMDAVRDRRQELVEQDQEPTQVFAGITAEGEHGGTILVVDSNKTGVDDTGRDRYQYVVRTAPVAGLATTGREFDEEYIPDTPDRRTYYRGTDQEIITSALGQVEVGLGSPDYRFVETPGESSHYDVPFATVVDSDGQRHRAVSMDDVFREPSHDQLVSAAHSELDPSKNAKRYPKIVRKLDAGDRARGFTAHKTVGVQHQLLPVVEAIDAPGLERSDLARLVNVGHTIMDIANRNPENADRPSQVLDPALAEHMAYAERPGQEERRGLQAKKPSIFGGRRRQSELERNRLEIEASAREARQEYIDSLKKSQNL